MFLSTFVVPSDATYPGIRTYLQILPFCVIGVIGACSGRDQIYAHLRASAIPIAGGNEHQYLHQI